MCGICGMVGPDPIDRGVLAQMTATLTHRGPDADGFHVATHGDVAVGLGFRRLAIIDLETGDQPLANENGSLHLVLNGELYNFRELRTELEARGHRFATHSDVEVLVHLYEDEGLRALDRINGMFAFALWDGSRRELILGRDRFGKKPLYYAQVGRGLVFGSEMKALLAHPRIAPAIDHDSLGRYLAAEYVPAPHSIIAGVRKVPAGCALRWRDGEVSIERYWDLPFATHHDSVDEAVVVERFREELRAAVRRRLISDVPLGAFLSGGVDSSSVVALMVEEGGADAVKTFSIAFEDESFDESAHARRVAAHLGTDHHEETFTAGRMLDVLPTVADFLDEPFADPSILPTYLLSRFAREHVTVALGGDGADELLGGYPTFAADSVLDRVPGPAAAGLRALAPLADRLPVSTRNFSTDFKIKRFLRAAGAPADERHPLWLGALSPGEQASVLTAPTRDPLDELRSAYRNAPTSDRVERLIYLYVKTYLQDDILVKVDRASMACSLEVRAPFLDRDLAAFLATVPPRLKLRGLSGKRLLKDAMQPVLPDGIANRVKKGFGIPVAEWLKGPLLEPLRDELSPARLDQQGLFSATAVQRLIDDHVAGRRDHRKPLWALFMFQLWHRRWIAP